MQAVQSYHLLAATHNRVRSRLDQTHAGSVISAMGNKIGGHIKQN